MELSIERLVDILGIGLMSEVPSRRVDIHKLRPLPGIVARESKRTNWWEIPDLNGDPLQVKSLDVTLSFMGKKANRITLTFFPGACRLEFKIRGYCRETFDCSENHVDLRRSITGDEQGQISVLAFDSLLKVMYNECTYIFQRMVPVVSLRRVIRCEFEFAGRKIHFICLRFFQDACRMEVFCNGHCYENYDCLNDWEDLRRDVEQLGMYSMQVCASLCHSDDLRSVSMTRNDKTYDFERVRYRDNIGKTWDERMRRPVWNDEWMLPALYGKFISRAVSVSYSYTFVNTEIPKSETRGMHSIFMYCYGNKLRLEIDPGRHSVAEFQGRSDGFDDEYYDCYENPTPFPEELECRDERGTVDNLYFTITQDIDNDSLLLFFRDRTYAFKRIMPLVRYEIAD